MQAKKTILRSLVVVLAAVVFGAGGWWYMRYDEGNANELVLYGNVDVREANLAFNNSERIEGLRVQEGDRVRKGQLLATLHEERLRASAAAAAARVASQKAIVARLEAGSRPQEILQAQSDVVAAEATLTDAETTLRRTGRLYKEAAASKQALDDALAARDNARAKLDIARQALDLAREGPRREDIEAAKATLESYRAELALAEQRVKDAALYAPADGIIRNRILELGDMATPLTPVFTLAFIDPVWVRAYLPEPALGKIAPGMAAEVRTDSYPERVYEGWVGYISPTAEFTPKNVETPELRTRLVYQVRVYACNPRGELRLGMPATVTIHLDQLPPAPGEPARRCGGEGS